MGKDQEQKQELLEAARTGNAGVVDAILAQRARRSGRIASLRRGPGANIQDSDGKTPLHYAAYNGHLEIVRLLLGADASPSMLDHNGTTPLHLAAWEGHAAVVRCLLTKPVNPVHVDMPTKNKGTALHCAAWSGHTDVVSQLLAHGADPRLQNSQGETPLDVAAQCGRLETVRHLLQVRPDLLKPYKAPAAAGCLFVDTPLHRASRHGHEQVVAALLDAGIDVNIRTCSEESALFEAAVRGKVAVVQCLLEHGALVNQVNKKKQTLLQVLEPYKTQVYECIRRMLIEYRQMNLSDLEEDGHHSPDFHELMTRCASPGDFDPTLVPEPPKTRDPSSNKKLSSALLKTHSNNIVKKITSKCLGLKAKFNSAPNISNTGLGSEVEVRLKTAHSSGDHRAKVTNTLHIGNSRFFKKLSRKSIEPVDVVCNDEFDTISLDRLVTIDRLSINNRSNRSCPGFKASLPNISESTELSDSNTSHEDVSVFLTEKNDGVMEAYNSVIRVRTPLPYAIPEFVEDGCDTKPNTTISNNTKTTATENDIYEPYSTVNNKQPEKKCERVIPPKRELSALNVVYENVVFGNRVATPLPAARKLFVPAHKETINIKKENIYVNLPNPLEKSVDFPVPAKRTAVSGTNNLIISDCAIETAEKSDSSVSSSRTSTMSLDTKIDCSNFEDILLSKKSKSFRKSFNNELKTVPSLEDDLTDSSSESSSVIGGSSSMSGDDSSLDGDIKSDNYVQKSRTLPNQKLKSKSTRKHNRNLTVTLGKINSEHLVNYHIRGTGHCVYSSPTIQEFVYVFNKGTITNNDIPNFTKVSKDGNCTYDTAICFCRPDEHKNHKSADDLTSKNYGEVSPKVTIDLQSLEQTVTSFRCYCVNGSCTLHNDRTATSFSVKFHALKKSISTPELAVPTIATSSSTVDPYAIVDLASVVRSSHDIACRQDSNSSNETSLTFGALSEVSSATCSLARAGSAGSSGSETLRGSASELSVASLYGSVGAGGRVVGSGSRRRWDEADARSEDALSLSSAASGSLPPRSHYHHRGYNKVSPTPPKKPPRRNLSVSPTHANSHDYHYHRTHARSQDDLDDLQEGKQYLKHGRSIDQYVDSKHSYSEYDSSPRVAPVPKPRPSLKPRGPPVAITAMYENVAIKEQNPRRKLRRNPPHQYENFDPARNRSSVESLLDSQSMNSPDERYYEGVRVPLSPTHYDQPPTPDHPPPSARHAENSIHERIRPLSQVSS